MTGWGFGVRGKRLSVPVAQQGQAWADWDAAEEAAVAAFEAANPTCICPLDRKGGIFEYVRECPAHRDEATA